jgi:hypothetical protein
MVRLAIKSIFGVLATSLLAGPTVFLVSILCLELAPLVGLEDVHSGQAGSGTLEGFLVWMLGSVVFGFWISVPASILNAIALSFFASRRIDSSSMAAAVGFIGGCIVLGMLFYMSSLPPPFTSFGTIVGEYSQQIAIVVAGTLMGLTYWFIAIRKHRSARLDMQ